MVKPVDMQTELVELQAAEDARRKALISGDWEAFQALSDKDLVVTHSNGRRDTRDSFLQSCRSGAVRYLRMEQSGTTVTLRRDHAVVSSVLHARIAIASGFELDVNALSTVVWSRSTEDQTWKLLAVHTTSLADERADASGQPSEFANKKEKQE